MGRHALLTAVAIATLYLTACPRAAAADPRPPAAAAPLPTMAEIQELRDRKRHPEVLKAVYRVLALRGDAAEKAAGEYNRYTLLVIKAETHLRLGAPRPAAAAFRDAA